MTSGTAASALETFLRRDLGRSGSIPLHEPWLKGNEWKYVKDCLDSGWVSSAGPYVERFERTVSKFVGARHGIATVNGTAGLHAMLIAIGVKPGDFVLCPALSFVATANAIAYCGATPVFIDADPETLGMCPRKTEELLIARGCKVEKNVCRLASGERIAAALPAHIFGRPVEMDRLLRVCQAYAIPVLEDAAEALGSRLRGRACGTVGKAGVVSFNGNKTVTCGGGGVIVTDDDELADTLKHLTTTARVGSGWEFDHDEIGFNYRLPNLNAAMGCAQMEQLDDFLKRKRRLAAAYHDVFRNVAGVEFLGESSETSTNNWLNAIMFSSREDRDAFLAKTNERQILTRPCWRLLCDLPMYRECPKGDDIPEACRIFDRLANIPSSPNLIGERP